MQSGTQGPEDAVRAGSNLGKTPGKNPNNAAVPGRRGGLRRLPRPVYGHIDSQSNILIPRRHKHTWAQLSYATQGYLQVWTPDARFVALSQRAVWIPAGVTHQVRQSPHTVIRSLYLDADALGLDWTACRVLAVSPLLHELIRRFSTLPVEYDPDGPDGRLGLSDKTLTRLFQRQTGLGFRLWRQRARLVHALPLLERGDRITDVALACGYDSLSSFIAAFRAHTGVTPRAFAARTHSEAL
jgi:AraC-like DNA-binding protein